MRVDTAAAQLTSAIVATAHGHATLMIDGMVGSGQHATEAAAERAAAATPGPDQRPGLPDTPGS